MVYEVRKTRIATKSILRTVGLVLLLSILVARGFPAQVQAADPPHFHATLFGDATQTTFMGYQAVRTDSMGFSTYGGIAFTLPDSQSIKLSDLTKLATDYYIQNGNCGGGSPRFSISMYQGSTFVGNVFVYIGPFPNFNTCTTGSWQSTGNLVTDPDPRWDSTQIHGTFYGTYSEAVTLASAQGLTVHEIDLVTDGGWSQVGGDQTVYFKNVMINNQVFFNHVACPDQNDDRDAKQQNHSELCEQKSGHGEQDDNPAQSEDPATEQSQNQNGADLSGEDLNTASYAGYDFTGANLQGADLSASDLTGANLAGADLSCANLSNANLTGANLLGAIVEGANLTGANLQGVDLSGVITVGDLVCQ
jgi:hypothetical protein